MSAEDRLGRATPTIIQEASEQKSDIEERTGIARQLRQEAEDILRAGGTEHKPRGIGRKQTLVLETAIPDDSGNEISVRILPRNNFDLRGFEPNLEKAAIEIVIEGYGHLFLPPAEKRFNIKTFGGGIKYPLPARRRLEQYSELLEVIREGVESVS
jgi:hypothetical protein